VGIKIEELKEKIHELELERERYKQASRDVNARLARLFKTPEGQRALKALEAEGFFK
jgi:hypothetical protein